MDGAGGQARDMLILHYEATSLLIMFMFVAGIVSMALSHTSVVAMGLITVFAWVWIFTDRWVERNYIEPYERDRELYDD